MARTRPTYRQAVEWIADNDESGVVEPVDIVQGYPSVMLTAELFNVDPMQVAEDVIAYRNTASEVHAERDALEVVRKAMIEVGFTSFKRAKGHGYTDLLRVGMTFNRGNTLPSITLVLTVRKLEPTTREPNRPAFEVSASAHENRVRRGRPDPYQLFIGHSNHQPKIDDLPIYGTADDLAEIIMLTAAVAKNAVRVVRGNYLDTGTPNT